MGPNSFGVEAYGVCAIAALAWFKATAQLTGPVRERLLTRSPPNIWCVIGHEKFVRSFLQHATGLVEDCHIGNQTGVNDFRVEFGEDALDCRDAGVKLLALDRGHGNRRKEGDGALPQSKAKQRDQAEKVPIRHGEDRK